MAATLSIVPSPLLLAAGEKYLIEATKQLSQGISFVSPSQYRIIEAVYDEELSVYDFTTLYVAKYGSLHSGKKVFIRLSTINSKGFQSVPVEKSAIIS